jgi:hypothetical protein
MGDSLTAPAGQQIHFIVRMLALENAHSEVIRDGELTTLIDASPAHTTDETRSFDYLSDGKRHWLRVNIRSSDGTLLVLGNPIYLNF